MRILRILLICVGAFLATHGSYSANLVGYWSLNENQGTTAGNSAISGYDGVVHGCTWSPSKVNSGLEFNGTSTDYVVVSNTTSPNPFAITHVTLSAWIYPKAYPAGDPVRWGGIVGKAYYSESTYGMRLGYDKRIHFCVYGPFGSGGAVTSFDHRGTTDVSLNKWHHAAVTYDGSSVKFYLDGVLNATHQESRLPGLYNQNIFIGSTYASGRYFSGYIDEAKIYDGALSAEEVAEEYESGGSSHCVNEADIALDADASSDMATALFTDTDSTNYRIQTDILDLATSEITHSSAQVVLRPSLLNSYFTRSYYTSETSAQLKGNINALGTIPENLSVSLALDTSDNQVASGTVSSTNDFSIQADISGLANGAHTAFVSLVQNQGVIYTEIITLNKYASANYESKIDKNSLHALINGEPFFPIGIFDIPEGEISEYAEAGFNITRGSSTSTYMDTAYYNGMLVTLATLYSIPKIDYSTKSPAVIESELRASSLIPTIQKVKGHPAFGGYFWDEPSEADNAGMEVLSRVTREQDPYHLIYPAFYQDSGPTISPDYYDVVEGDFYWYGPQNNSTCKLYTRLDNYLNICKQIRKPFWFVPEAAGWYSGSAITPVEQRIQTYLGIIHEAGGIYYWTYNNTYPAMRTMLKILAGELQGLSPVLLETTPAQSVSGVDTTGVHALAKVYDGDLYLICANNSNNLQKNISIGLSLVTSPATAEVLFENRSVDIDNNTITDQFQPYATHVYHIVSPTLDTNSALTVALSTISSTTITPPAVRRWPDADTLYETVGNPGFEDAEDGQPRLWTASCGWEMPEYCSLDESQYCEGSRSLKLSLPSATTFTAGSGFGWSSGLAVRSFDLGAARGDYRYGHTDPNDIFKVSVPNGTYTLAITGNIDTMYELQSGVRQTLSLSTNELPAATGVFNKIIEYTCTVAVNDGCLDLEIPSGAIYTLSISDGQSASNFEFGTEDSPVSNGYVKVSASRVTYVSIVSGNGGSYPTISMDPAKNYKLTVYLKSDIQSLPVRFGMRKDSLSGPTVYRNATVGTSWQKYELSVSPEYRWVYVQTNGGRGTVWVDSFALEEQ